MGGQEEARGLIRGRAVGMEVGGEGHRGMILGEKVWGRGRNQ